MGVVVDVLVARLAEERHHEQAHHVEGREDRRGEPDPEEEREALVGRHEDLRYRLRLD